MTDARQGDLFGGAALTPSLPTGYIPLRPHYFEPSRIYLAAGSLATPQRRRFVEDICDLYPEVGVEEYLDTPHNRLDLKTMDPLALHQFGKHTLVFGELKTAVRFSEEKGNTCPNYWHFSPYGFCPFGCKYCYLAGTQGVKFSPTVKIYVNLPDMLGEVDRVAVRHGRPIAFYLGKLQDPLALDLLTAYSTVLVPFFAKHPLARLTLLTKSASVDRLLQLDHGDHTILSWSINPPEVSAAFEENVPSIDARLEAMCRAAQQGYPVRAVIMPIVPIEDWQDVYGAFTRRLVETVPIELLTLGGVCMYRGARQIMDQKMGSGNVISLQIDSRSQAIGDGRARYPKSVRQAVYSHIVQTARSLRPDLPIALCLEERSLWEATGLETRLGHCNCVL